ncbi:ABC transporter permease, partial [Caldivirga sp.]|uniref:ABC transporter permease n=1 Tax=Caldivirga sp. TaxID=2080243 RepID=UPI0025BCC69F
PRLWPPIYWFGTDNVGEPLLVDIVNGAPFVLEVSLLTALYTTVLGLLVGIVAGFSGGYVDAALSFISQVLMTIPSLLLVMIMATMIHTNNPLILSGILSITGWTGLALSVRSQILSMRELPYIEVSRVLGLSGGYILFKEITPKIMPYVWINFILNMEGAVYASVGLYFLGLLPFQNYNWGALISEALGYGAYYGGRALPILIVPVVFVTLYMVALIELAYGIDEVINPRLRK